MNPVLELAAENVSLGWLMGVMTVFFLVSFLAWVWWAYPPKNKAMMDEAALIPVHGRRQNVSKDTDRLMGHAEEADGIEEYDNPLPDWWLGLFWLCIIWAIGYTIHYHFIADRSQAAELSGRDGCGCDAMARQDAADVAFALTPEAIQGGEVVFNTYCFVCHGANLEGESARPSWTRSGSMATLPKKWSIPSRMVCLRKGWRPGSQPRPR